MSIYQLLAGTASANSDFIDRIRLLPSHPVVVNSDEILVDEVPFATEILDTEAPTSKDCQELEPDLDSLEFSLDLDLPDFQRGPDLQSVTDIAYLGEFLLGTGVIMQIFAKLIQTVSYNAESGT